MAHLGKSAYSGRPCPAAADIKARSAAMLAVQLGNVAHLACWVVYRCLQLSRAPRMAPTRFQYCINN